MLVNEKMLYQYNIAWMRKSFDDALWDDFRSQLHEVHEHAKTYSGFVFRYEGEKDALGYIKPYADPFIMGNFSAWTNYDELFEYTFTGPHLEMMKMKRKWFKKPELFPYNVLYYSDKPTANTLEHAKVRLLNFQLSNGKESNFHFNFGKHKGIFT